MKKTLLFLTLLIMGLGVGCSLAPKTGVDYSYYYPDWTLDGKIICVKQVEEWSETTPWPYGAPMRSVTSTKYYITTMSEEGTQETNIKQIDRLGKVAASPLGNYIAYTDGDYIKVITTAGANVNSIDCEENVNSLDWSPNENDIAFSIYKDGPSWEIYSISRGGSGATKTFLTLGDLGSWGSDNKYLCYDLYLYSNNVPIDGGIYLYELSTKQSVKLTTMEGAAPDFIGPDNDFLVYVDGNWIKRININIKNKDNIISQSLSIPKCKSDGIRVVCGKYTDSGIWVINIDGTSLKQIK